MHPNVKNPLSLCAKCKSTFHSSSRASRNSSIFKVLEEKEEEEDMDIDPELGNYKRKLADKL